MRSWFSSLLLAVAAALLALPGSIVEARPAPVRPSSQDAPCGVVDAIDYPIDGISLDYDDFGLYRAPFTGRHTGIDMAFDRYGEPVHAAARGRVTFSDPNGWDTEKGVVIIEHIFPDNSIAFTLYGHMEPINGYTFPRVGQCVEMGEIVGAVGHPSRGASHLHYEIRQTKASTGGPGYSDTEPLDGGWYHPIDFTERWKLELSPEFRAILTASGAPTAPPIFQPDGGAVFAAENNLERRNATNETVWRLGLSRLSGIVTLPDGRILGRTADDQIVLVDNGRFSATWKPDRPLASPPYRVGDSVVFIGQDQRVVSYSPDGATVWQAGPFGTTTERAVVSGNLLALSVGSDGGFQIFVLNSEGKIVFEAGSPAPVLPFATTDGFVMLVGSQVGRLTGKAVWQPLMDIGITVGRQAQLAVDPKGGVVVYPGFGQKLYAFGADGKPRWQAALTGNQLQPPLLAIGQGCLIYALTANGGLLAFRAGDGQLRGFTALYAGGARSHVAARWLRVLPGEQVQFSAGFLSIATVDGPMLAGTGKCDS